MKKFKFCAIILGLSFGLTAMGVNAWTYKPYGIIFTNWGTQTIYTDGGSYVAKDTDTPQRWETLDVSNGGNPEVVLQNQTMGTVTDNLRIYLSPGSSYTWKTYLSKYFNDNNPNTNDNNMYRLKFVKNGWTLGMTEVTGFWWKY